MDKNLAVRNETNIEAQDKGYDITPADFSILASSLLATVGTIELSAKQQEILYADVDPRLVEIRPDGLIYLPWMEYATRLRKAFALNWAMVPISELKMQGNLMIREYILIINGKLATSPVYGEQEYFPNNKMMTYGDAAEGVKSNALMRLCKGIGIGLELWQPSFIREWKSKYAVSEKKKDRNGYEREAWRRIDGIVEEHFEIPEQSNGKEKGKNTDNDILAKLSQELLSLSLDDVEKRKKSKANAINKSEMKDEILKIYDAIIAQKTLELLATKTGFSEAEIDRYLEWDKDNKVIPANLIKECLAGNDDAISQFSKDLAGWLNDMKKAEQLESEQVIEEVQETAEF